VSQGCGRRELAFKLRDRLGHAVEDVIAAEGIWRAQVRQVKEVRAMSRCGWSERLLGWSSRGKTGDTQ
jgi:hypothetical protein